MIPSLAGGLLIGLAAVSLYATLGRIAGVSGIAFNAFEQGQRAWRLAMLAGLIGGGWLMIGAGAPVPAPTARDVPLLLLGGLLVGVGTRLGNGCTSGHGICGLARLSPRSLVAVAVFMATGSIVATLLRGALP